MRLLGIFGFRLILPRCGRDVAAAVIRTDHAARGSERFLGDVHAVGSHIGDEADGFAFDVHAFIEPLRDAHRMRRRETEFAARLLLQGRSGEWGRGVAPGRLGFDRAHRERRVLQRLFERFGFGSRADIETLDLLSIGADKARLEHVAARRGERGHQRPIFARHEFFDFQLAVANQAQRHRLHASGRARARQLAPQHRREREADQIIEGAAREIGVDQGRVDLARVLHRVEHGLLGDRVEHHAFHHLLLERVLLLEHLQHMPGNGLALAVGVGGEDQLVGAFEGVGYVVEALLGLGIDLPNCARGRPSRPWPGGRARDRKRPRPRSRGQDIYAGSWLWPAIQQQRYSCKSNVLGPTRGPERGGHGPRLSRPKVGMSTLPVKRTSPEAPRRMREVPVESTHRNPLHLQFLRVRPENCARRT